MIWLLDISALVAYLAPEHVHHQRAVRWWSGRRLAVCPLTELGFLRVNCFLGASMKTSLSLLAQFYAEEQPLFIPCDRRVLECAKFTTAAKTTDLHLARSRCLPRVEICHL